jgi:hypothetical protein
MSDVRINCAEADIVDTANGGMNASWSVHRSTVRDDDTPTTYQHHQSLLTRPQYSDGVALNGDDDIHNVTGRQVRGVVRHREDDPRAHIRLGVGTHGRNQTGCGTELANTVPEDLQRTMYTEGLGSLLTEQVNRPAQGMVDDDTCSVASTVIRGSHHIPLPFRVDNSDKHRRKQDAAWQSRKRGKVWE